MAQKTKSIEVCRIQTCVIKGLVHYNEDNAPSDTVYAIMARDSRYEQLIEYVIIYHGDFLELHESLMAYIEFYEKEEDGVREGQLSIHKIYGVKTLQIDELEESGHGYTTFTGSALKKLLAKTESWAKENNIALK